MRTTARSVSALVLLVALAGCSEAQDAVDGAQGAVDSATKARDCVALAGDTLQSRIADAQQVDAQEVRQAADRLSERVGQIEDADLRTAAESLQAALVRASDAVAQGDTSAIRQSRDEAVAAARRTASECGIPVDRFLG
ncbi:hypothetical protein [Motilibacter aurantiacus]|uniref:hypothetical protein n=1 Tax=Motilibacter aurantiacus TaxID=2714955 RepID=UPI00140E592C|nr:hypothetical protein [Motilibacter aurantiacus]NHC43768.1 hypothetical protein [Motilibacter aurantiacus]